MMIILRPTQGNATYDKAVTVFQAAFELVGNVFRKDGINVFEWIIESFKIEQIRGGNEDVL